jgi:aryl-alcohol dehydrogenase-like predicted oxidoreductase
MNFVKLGTSSLKISPLTIGCWSFGGGAGSYWGLQDQNDVNDLVSRALDYGVNFFDTAFGYNEGRSERSLGLALKGKRNQAVICNKIPIQAANKLPDYEQTIKDSLERLQTDVIDVMMIHWPTRDEGLLRANLEALQSMQSKGFIREIGVSNFGLRTLEIAKEMEIPVIVNEFAYNLMTRGIEGNILPYCRERNIGIAAYMPLMQGILTGKFRTLDDIPAVRKRSIQFSSKHNSEARHGGPGAESSVVLLLDQLKQLSKKTGIPQSHLAIGWLMAKDGVSTVIAGCRNADQLQENIKAVETRLDPDLISALDQASEPLKNDLKGELDLWQMGSASRIW